METAVMSMNARMGPNDPRLYNPNRDVAHNFEFVITEVANAIERGKWDALRALAVRDNLSDEELGKACAAICKFVVVQADDQKESMASCLARCGFLDLHPTSRIIVMAYLGQTVLGMHWAGVREATLNGEGPAMTYGKLRWYGHRVSLLMTLPKWRRSLLRVRNRFKRAYRALTGKTDFDG